MTAPRLRPGRSAGSGVSRRCVLVDGLYVVDLTTDQELPSEFLVQLQAA